MIRRSSSQHYVCWRCLCLAPTGRVLLVRQRIIAPSSIATASAASTAATPFAPRRPPQQQQQRRAVSTEQSTASPSDPLAVRTHQFKELRSDSQESSIRERLRKWEADNPTPALVVPRDDPSDGRPGNVLTKNRLELGMKLDVATEDDDTARPHFDGDDVVDLGLDSSPPQAGDLIELGSGVSRTRMLAICLGTFNGQLHFYTISGKWFTSRSFRTGFVVRNFVQDPGELRAVIDAIPSLSSSSTVLNELQDLNIGPSRDLAASLIRKMYTFQSAARLVHQTYVERLSSAHKRLGRDERLLSLREIADALLPASLKRNRGAFPPEALYAVYSVIEEDDVAFRALNRVGRRDEAYMFVLQSADAQENLRRVEQLVRDYYELISGQSKPASRAAAATTAEFHEFLLHARGLIDQARNRREWSRHGMVGPCRKDSPPASELDIPRWTKTSLAIIKFIEHWAASSGFHSGSRWHWIGASVLRALRRYDDALLSDTTGWTFLQEIGWLPPWDVSARYALRLPGTQFPRHAALVPPPDTETTALPLPPDRLAGLRQEFARSTVYCIDSTETRDVDDGISLESLGGGEFWVHVHVADPASRITPKSVLAQQAASRVQTNYLAGFYSRMFDGDHVREAFSLGPNQPTLTFSARIDETGRLLDSKVTPGILRDVVYITPEDVTSVCDDGNAAASSAPATVLEVGTRPAGNPPPTRSMTTAQELSRRQRNELKTLSKLATALQRARLDKGAVPVYLPRPQAKVSMDAVVQGAIQAGSVFYDGDPYIRVQYDNQGIALVSSLMQLAGEVGARWCYERDIPVPYRVQLLAGKDLNALSKFNREVFFPQLLAGKSPSSEDWHTLRTLSGGFDVSTTPAPNPALGLDLYTKVTSPLRRYSDLLVHWQIETALLREHHLGKSLAFRKLGGEAGVGGAEGTTAGGKSSTPAKEKAAKESREWLPFSKAELESNVLPQLRIRERHSKLLDKFDGNSQWILQALVRAWSFGEGASQLPETFRFTVSDVAGKRAANGRLDWFNQPATAEIAGMTGVVRIGDVSPGDVFKAELLDVNVRCNKIYVKLLERLERGGQ